MTAAPASSIPATTQAAPVSKRSGVLEICAVGLAFATAAGSLGAWHWTLDLFSHFRCYYFGFAVLTLIGMWRRKPSAFHRCLAVVLLWNGVLIAPYLPYARPQSAGDKVPISIVSLNVHTRNQDKKAVVDYLRQVRPDLIVVMEIDVEWTAALKELHDLYPHRLMNPRSDNFGIGLLSMWPLTRPHTVDFADNELPSIVANVQHESSLFQLIATHPLPPVGAVRSEERNRQLRKVADFVKTSTNPSVVAGDFNATPWSSAFLEFAKRSDLQDTAVGRGVQGSWNARAWFMRIPIDHVFVPTGTTILERAIGPDVGSDHFPVEAKFVLP